MKVKCKALLLIDGIVNLLLGIVLLLFPFGIAIVLTILFAIFAALFIVPLLPTV